ncbi:hypothetical protein [Methanosarcina sp.]|uniref:hypothetical protein n=1 Tax=Methanosarcina sp. TaxID=2213 RepID=UPI002AB8D286|nr:hypothetical protein [Methanosarcina sp.]MDY9925265.1 hypothetical protein [Methanosarcina sp.]
MNIVCRNCDSNGKEKCWNCDGAGGAWKEIAGERKWEERLLCWGEGFNSCVNCDGTGWI